MNGYWTANFETIHRGETVEVHLECLSFADDSGEGTDIEDYAVFDEVGHAVPVSEDEVWSMYLAWSSSTAGRWEHTAEGARFW